MNDRERVKWLESLKSTDIEGLTLIKNSILAAQDESEEIRRENRRHSEWAMDQVKKEIRIKEIAFRQGA